MTKQILKKIERENVRLIEMQFSDLWGGVRSVTITKEQLLPALNRGIWFDGSSIKGFARISESDMILYPDLSTYALLPCWSNKENGAVARIICDIRESNGKPFSGDPRGILKTVLQEALSLGFTYYLGPEIEFFLFKRDASGKIDVHSQGNGDYFILSMDEVYEIKKEIIETIKILGIQTEMSHYEVANNQHEIDFHYSEALTAADSVITIKYIIKKIAAKHGFFASFLPKPIFGVNGSGMHCHQSLFTKKGENAFFNQNDIYGLSKIAYQFISGQLKYIREICAITAPIVNSYKRLALGYEAPVYICWARKNRSSLIRIPAISSKRKNATRIELRCPDPACNPYLAFAVMLKAGLEGLKKNLKPPKPVEGNVYEFNELKLKNNHIGRLPGSLDEALKLMEKGSIVKQVLGSNLFSRYLKIKRQEWDSFRTAVTDWERKRYLETI